MAERAQRRLGAVMMTDLVDSTATMIRLGPRYKAVADHHDDFVARILTRHGACLRGTGDGFMAIFDSVVVAIEAACELQWALEEYRAAATADDRYHIRIGLSAGELQWGGVQTAQGPAINEAARAEAKAAPDEILATDIVRVLSTLEFGDGFTDPHDVELKGLPGTTKLWTIDWRSRPPRSGPIPLPGAFSAAASRPFFGRHRELAELEEAWGRVAGGSRELVLLRGEAGIGKSTVARTFALAVHAQGASVFSGRCDPDRLVPYQPFVEALGTFTAHVPARSQLFGSNPDALATLTPRAPRGADAAGEGATDADRFFLFEAVTDWLTSNAAEHPVLVVVDDLHWADRPTLQLVRHLLRSQGPEGFLIVATMRDTHSDWSADFEDVLVDFLRLDGVCHSVHLGGLDAAAIAAAVASRAAAIASTHELTEAEQARLVGWLERYTGGNPLFLDSLLDAADIGELVDRVGAPDAVGGGSVPDAIVAQVRPSYRRLGREAQELVAVATVEGHHFRRDVLAEVTGLDPHEIEAGLDQLIEHGLIEAGGKNGEYQFAHRLVRDAMVSVAVGSSLTRLHEAIGRALIALAGADTNTDAGKISLHLSYSPDPVLRATAAHHATSAAQQALRGLAPAVAATHFERALELWATVPNGLGDVERVALLMDLGYARKHSGVPGADHALLDAAEMAEALGDARLMARAALASLRGTWSLTGAIDERKVDVVRRALAAIGDTDPSMSARLLGGLATELTFSADRTERDAAIAEAVAIARRLERDAPDDPHAAATLSRVLQSQHAVLSDPAGLAQRVELVAEMDRRTSTGSAYARFTTATNGYWTAIETGNAAECRRRLAVIEDIAAELDQPRLNAYATFFGSTQCAVSGRLTQALELGARALDLQKAIGEPDAETWWVGIRYIPFLELGRLPELIDDLGRALARAPSLGSMRAGLAHAYAISGEPERCRAQLDELPMERVAMLHQDRLSTLAMMTMASIECDVGDVQTAVRTSLAPFAGSVIFNGSACFGPVEHYLGLLAAAAGDHDAADAHFGAAADLSTRLGAPVLLAETNLAWGATLLERQASGDHARARAITDYASRCAADLDLVLLGQRAERMVELVDAE